MSSGGSGGLLLPSLAAVGSGWRWESRPLPPPPLSLFAGLLLPLHLFLFSSFSSSSVVRRPRPPWPPWHLPYYTWLRAKEYPSGRGEGVEVEAVLVKGDGAFLPFFSFDALPPPLLLRHTREMATRRDFSSASSHCDDHPDVKTARSKGEGNRARPCPYPTNRKRGKKIVEGRWARRRRWRRWGWKEGAAAAAAVVERMAKDDKRAPTAVRLLHFLLPSWGTIPSPRMPWGQ